jgi:hypothetical protein
MSVINPIAGKVRKELLSRLKAAEKEHNVKVLYAVESGSRAWGFESRNSDYDVRFIYAHPEDWYLSVDLEEKRDVIEYDIVDDFDISGWELRKALKLLYKSNPNIVEWLQSPIVYIDDGFFAAQCRKLIDSLYSFQRGIYHYRSMAKTNYRGYLKNEIVPLKKYFYVLRPLLSVIWLEKHKKPAPIEFELLRPLVAHKKILNLEISSLLDRKRVSIEKEMIPTIPVINEFILSELERLERYGEMPENTLVSMESLNALFRRIIAEI